MLQDYRCAKVILIQLDERKKRQTDTALSLAYRVGRVERFPRAHSRAN